MHLQTAIEIQLGQEHLHIPKGALHLGNAWNVQRHCNAQWEFHFIRKGQCRVDIDRAQYILRAGQAVLILPGLYHQAKSLTQELERFTLGFLLPDGTVFQHLLNRMSTCPVFTPDSTICLTIQRIWEESKQQNPFADAYTQALIRCLVIELLRGLGVHSTNAGSTRSDPDTQLTQVIDTFFEQHFAQSGGEALLARHLHFSRRHLVRILKKHYNMTFREKLTHARMDYAAFLLRTTELSVSRIGEEVGYNSESAFFKTFNRHFGMTPRQYRDNYK